MHCRPLNTRTKCCKICLPPPAEWLIPWDSAGWLPACWLFSVLTPYLASKEQTNTFGGHSFRCSFPCLAWSHFPQWHLSRVNYLQGRKVKTKERKMIGGMHQGLCGSLVWWPWRFPSWKSYSLSTEATADRSLADWFTVHRGLDWSMTFKYPIILHTLPPILHVLYLAFSLAAREPEARIKRKKNNICLFCSKGEKTEKKESQEKPWNTSSIFPTLVRAQMELQVCCANSLFLNAIHLAVCTLQDRTFGATLSFAVIALRLMRCRKLPVALK